MATYKMSDLLLCLLPVQEVQHCIGTRVFDPHHITSPAVMLCVSCRSLVRECVHECMSPFVWLRAFFGACALRANLIKCALFKITIFEHHAFFNVNNVFLCLLKMDYLGRQWTVRLSIMFSHRCLFALLVGCIFYYMLSVERVSPFPCFGPLCCLSSFCFCYCQYVYFPHCLYLRVLRALSLSVGIDVCAGFVLACPYWRLAIFSLQSACAIFVATILKQKAGIVARHGSDVWLSAKSSNYRSISQQIRKPIKRSIGYQ